MVEYEYLNRRQTMPRISFQKTGDFLFSAPVSGGEGCNQNSIFRQKFHFLISAVTLSIITGIFLLGCGHSQPKPNLNLCEY